MRIPLSILFAVVSLAFVVPARAAVSEDVDVHVMTCAEIFRGDPVRTRACESRARASERRRARQSRRETPAETGATKDATMHVVGVYEGTLPKGVVDIPWWQPCVQDDGTMSGGCSPDDVSQHPTGNVTVNVKASSSPIVLVLTSYEAVEWKLKIDKKADVRQVILSGYEMQTAKGVGTIPVESWILMPTCDDCVRDLHFITMSEGVLDAQGQKRLSEFTGIKKPTSVQYKEVGKSFTVPKSSRSNR